MKTTWRILSKHPAFSEINQATGELAFCVGMVFGRADAEGLDVLISQDIGPDLVFLHEGSSRPIVMIREEEVNP